MTVKMLGRREASYALDDDMPMIPFEENEEWTQFADSLTVQKIHGLFERLWGGASFWEPSSADAPTTQRQGALAPFVETLVDLLFIFFLWWMPESLSQIATPLLANPAIEEWLQWVTEAIQQEWPPTVTVWGILTEAKRSKSLDLDRDMVTWFSRDCEWQSYFQYRVTLSEERQQFIQQAIDAYNAGLYAASTVLFLTQVDGVIYDLTALSWTRQQREWLLDHLTALPPEIQRWTAAVSSTLASAAASGEPDQLDSFNRNKIMHGLGTDFNTPVHALKAAMLVELVWYVCFVSSLWVDSPALGESRRQQLTNACSFSAFKCAMKHNSPIDVGDKIK